MTKKRAGRDLTFESPRSVRRDAGKAQRRVITLESHANVPTTVGRCDPVEILTDQDEARQADLVPIRHGRMTATAFTFYRGAAAIMAADLATLPTTDLRVQLCGDAHLSNFGLFHGPDRRLVFDLNDFDETIPGPFDWDVKRLAASVEIAGRNNDFSSRKRTAATMAAVSGYRETIAESALETPLEIHYRRLEIEQFVAKLNKKAKARADKATKKARRKNSLRAFEKLTDVVDGQRVIVADLPLITPVDRNIDGDAATRLRTFFDEYVDTLPRHRKSLLERYHFADLAHKVVGVGSVGTACWILLLMSGDDEPIFLQLKEATTSALEPYVGASEFDQAGERVVEGQRVMQTAGDVFLGWARHEDSSGIERHYYFRQLWDGKASADIEDMGPKRLRRYAWFCGATLALAHARSGDPALIGGYLGDDDTFDRAIASFASAYADINEADHAAHDAAISSGRIEAIRDI
jgi:uncharacterized protein (DUF2252 family)